MAEKFNGLPKRITKPNPPKITRTITIEVSAVEDHIPIKGNALASGDEKMDREQERWIRHQLDGGNVWAWAQVEVKATISGDDEAAGFAHMGACSYLNGADFATPASYFSDMVKEAVGELIQKWDDAARAAWEEKQRAESKPK